MDRASLVFSLRKDDRDAFQHAKAFIANNETYTCKAAALEPGKEVQPAFFVLFHAFRCAENLTESVFIDANGKQNRNVLDFATPAALKVNTVDVNIGVFAR